MNDVKWFVVYTKPRWEKKVVDQLVKKGIQAYCPTRRTSSAWFDKKKNEGILIFDSYVFVCLSERNVLELRQVHGIMNFVYWLGQPAVVSSEEIEMIKNITTSYSIVRLEKNVVKVNDEIVLTNDTRMFRKGDVLEVRNTAVRVSLPSLGYYLIAENKSDEAVDDINYQRSISVTKPSF